MAGKTVSSPTRRGLKHGEEALLEEIEKMHARPEVREILIAGKLKR
jgi:hypothetical protein